MIFPNKAISFADSALGLSTLILEHKEEAEIELIALYQNISNKFESIDQFLLAVDLLFVLGRIDVDFERGVVIYAN